MNTMIAAVARGRQQGVALITVLLVFALAVVIAAEIMSRHQMDIRRTANTLNNKQAYHYAIGGEQFAKQLLYRDFVNDSEKKSDNLTDVWAQAHDTFVIENGHMSIQIIDQQGLFNLNNLRNGNARAAAQFRRLLRVLAIDNDYTEALQDWLDVDNVPNNNGAEDETYLSQHKPYLSANRDMVDVSELLLLNKLTSEDYHLLKKYVVALPAATQYNINTLDSRVVQALSTQIDSGQASTIARLQKIGGYDDLSKWLGSGAAKSLAAIQQELDVSSEYFETVVKTVYDTRTSVVRTQMFRDKKNGRIQIIKRQQGFE